LAAVTSDGRLVTWGNPDQGKLGHSASLVKEQKTYGYQPRSTADYNAMNFVGGELDGKKIRQVSCGILHTACLTEDG
jgi:alpha-tubulin suppressor-like RCC1 family protein